MKRVHDEEEEKQAGITKKQKKRDDEKGDQTLVTLNVGGTLLCTSRRVLRETYPTSVIARMFSEEHIESMKRDANGCFFIDTDGGLFSVILHCMRRGLQFDSPDVAPPHIAPLVWRTELDYWGLLPLPAESEVSSTDVIEESLGVRIEKQIEVANRRMEKTLELLFTLTGKGDYIERGMKDMTFLIPRDVYLTEWGEDIFMYLYNARTVIEMTFDLHKKRRLWVHNIKLYHSRAMKYRVNYTFHGKQYNTVDHETLQMGVEVRYFT